MSYLKLLDDLSIISSKSLINNQHGSVLIKSGRPMSWGFNSITGGKSIHAEVSTCMKLLSNHGFLGWLKQRHCILREKGSKKYP
jgi:hypothetical protein